MIESPRVSVVCLAYNQERYIAQTLDSFLAQRTDFPFEIVVNDDASTDGTRAILEDYRRRHPDVIRLILQPENLYRQRVRLPPILLEAARGEYVAYCEGDDFWTDPGKLQAQAALLDAQPGVGAVFTDANLLYVDSGRLLPDYDRRSGNPVPRGDVRRVLLTFNPYRSCTAMFRRDLVRGYEHVAQQLDSRMDDWVMWLYLARRARIEYLPRTTATYRVQRESVSHSASAFKNVRAMRSQHRIARWFNREYGGILDAAALRDFHRRDALDRSLRLHRWRAAWRRAASPWEFLRGAARYGAKRVAVHLPWLYRLAPLGRARGEAR